MTMAIGSSRPFNLGNVKGATGGLTPSGNYATGGDAVDFTVVPRYFDGRKPDFLIIVGKAGYIYAYDAANGKVMVFFADNNNAADGPLIEIPAAAYPAGVTGDVITFFAIWSPVV